MSSRSIVVASRLHWNNHSRNGPIDAEKALAQVKAFCSRATTYGSAIVLALGLPPPLSSHQSTEPDVFVQSVYDFVAHLQSELDALSLVQGHGGRPCPVRLVPLTFWGQFVPALNAIISTAATDFPDSTHILFQSLEIQVQEHGVAHLCRHFLDGSDLVVGAALPGQAFMPEEQQPLPLDGRTTPWNTLALWDAAQLAKVGVPLVADGLRVGVDNAGVEEVATIALYQSLYPTQCRAKVVQVPGLAWHVQEFEDPERRVWQQRKMENKKARPAKQLELLRLPPAIVYHVA